MGFGKEESIRIGCRQLVGRANLPAVSLQPGQGGVGSCPTETALNVGSQGADRR